MLFVIVTSGNLGCCAKGHVTQVMIWKRKLSAQVCDAVIGLKIATTEAVASLVASELVWHMSLISFSCYLS